MLTELGGKNQRGSEIRVVDPTDTLSRELLGQQRAGYPDQPHPKAALRGDQVLQGRWGAVAHREGNESPGDRTPG